MPVQKIKIRIVASINKIKLPFALTKLKSFSKILMYSTASRGQKLLKIRIFHENGLFSVRMFYDQPLACPVVYYWKELSKLIRMVFNLLKSVHIWWTYHDFNPRPYFSICCEDKIGLKFITFYPSSYLRMWYIILFGFMTPFNWCIIVNGYS